MTIATPSLAPPLREINPPKWPSPRGYSHAMAGTGTFVFIGGQIATDNAGRVTSIGLVPQARQALRNVRTVLAEAGGAPEDIAQMTWYVLDIDHYRMLLKEIGVVYQEVMGHHYPAMALVEVTGLVNPAAVVEIAATAILPVGAPSSPVTGSPIP
ncbi:RidA family protein [Microvirga guangxiensis]|uniref:Enamine deaminase RidA, house cleaning of reactive enamine intermediates, YjgF/YER057c/UK114 family n=1 Tax=Microvirga guangxiensis TaxID=549386 RepID=A0A1G5H292_9HYPH|nr:RidA family protein [Microvirga guangxiensis]SCY57943.1 Enamine deaminase RidA, house cleaning of reactive enamine intermediates, YjgF/YER057c/UK114 family [Microvirga guangxiensis]